MMEPGAYGGLLLAGIVVGAALWCGRFRRDPRLLPIYFAAMLGALLGAKVVYLLAEGWIDWHRPDAGWRLAVGKSILGGLVFGYLGVEAAKKLLDYRAPTGDAFALVTPVGLTLGRIGCWLHGCCLGRPCPPSWYALPDPHGVPRWPAVPAELAFQLVALSVILWLHRIRWRPGQLFHGYLIAYGTFRFLHEFVRDTPRILGPLSGYHFAALALGTLGVIRFVQRERARANPAATMDAIPEPDC